jgi:methionyl aminopeptidase
VAVVLRELRRRVQAGVSTAELDRVAGRVLARYGARSAPMLVYGAPCEVFISVNDEAVHGIHPHPPRAGCAAATSSSSTSRPSSPLVTGAAR